MKVGDLIIMLRFSTSQPVYVEELSVDQNLKIGRSGPIAVYPVVWSEIHGDTVTSISEYWKPLAPNMFLAMSLKK